MSSRRPGLRRTIQVVVIALVAYWIILPLVPQFFDAAHDLNRIEPNLLLAGFGLQMISLFFYSMLTKAALGGDGDDASLPWTDPLDGLLVFHQQHRSPAHGGPFAPPRPTRERPPSIRLQKRKSIRTTSSTGS